jgi:hypothetical protein
MNRRNAIALDQEWFSAWKTMFSRKTAAGTDANAIAATRLHPASEKWDACLARILRLAGPFSLWSGSTKAIRKSNIDPGNIQSPSF